MKTIFKKPKHRELTNLEKLGFPSPTGMIEDLEWENKGLRQKLRQAKKMIQSLTETLESKIK